MSEAPSKRSVSKPILLGCCALLVLLLLSGSGLALLGWKGFQAGMERAARDEELAESWSPPAGDAPPNSIAPATVAGYELTTFDDRAAFPALGLDAEGHHLVYAKGDDTIEISMYRMTDGEKSAAFDEIIRRIDDDDRFSSHSHVRLPRSLEFSVSPPSLSGRLWHAGGWLVFVRSTMVEELQPFLEAYLETVSAASARPVSADQVE